jgi:hypothetical protein
MSITDLKAEGPSDEYIDAAFEQTGGKFLMPTADDRWFLYEQGKKPKELSAAELAEILGEATAEHVIAATGPAPSEPPNAPES